MNRSLIAELGLGSIILAALFSFGAVPHWSYLGISAAAFFFCMICPEIFADNQKIDRIAIIAAALLFLWVSVQTLFFSLNTAYSIFQLVPWAAGLCIFLLCQKLSRDGLVRLHLFFLAAVILVVLYGLIQFAGSTESVLWETKKAHQGFLTGTFRNRNHFSGLLELASGVLLGTIFRFFEKKKPAAAIAMILLFFLVLAGIVLAGSRTGFACVFFMVIVFFVFMTLAGHHRGLSASLGVITLIALIIAVYFGWDIFADRLGRLSTDLETWEGRVTVWREVLTMLPDFLWTGTGLGNFGYAYALYQSPEIIYHWAHAHQDYLELMIELGLPGFLLLAAVFAGILKTIFENMADKDYSSIVIAAGCVAGCAALALHGFVDFNFAIPANHFMFIFVLGTGCRILHFQRRKLMVRKDYRGGRP